MRWMQMHVAVVSWMAGFLVLSATGTAWAKGAIVYHTGEDVFEVAPIGPEVAAAAVDQLIKSGLLAEEDRASETASMTAELTPLKLGYRCSIFGLFFAYFWWSGCELVLYKWTGANEFEYMPVDVEKFREHIKSKASDEEEVNVQVQIHQAVITALEAKAGGKKLADAYPTSAMKMGFWQKNGRWILLLVVLGLIAAAVLKGVLGKKAAVPPPAAAGGGFAPPAAPPSA